MSDRPGWVRWRGGLIATAALFAGLGVLVNLGALFAENRTLIYVSWGLFGVAALAVFFAAIVSWKRWPEASRPDGGSDR